MLSATVEMFCGRAGVQVILDFPLLLQSPNSGAHAAQDRVMGNQTQHAFMDDEKTGQAKELRAQRVLDGNGVG